MQVNIYCDGACSQGAGAGADKIGAYAAVLQSGPTKASIVASELDTTNNRMEMMGAIAALKLICKKTTKTCDITITSDSAYLVNGMTKWVKGWQEREWKTASKKPVANKDLWLELIELTSKHNVEFKWIRGHADSPENNECDKLAVAEIKKRRKEISDANSNTFA